MPFDQGVLSSFHSKLWTKPFLIVAKAYDMSVQRKGSILSGVNFAGDIRYWDQLV